MFVHFLDVTHIARSHAWMEYVPDQDFAFVISVM